MIFQEDFNDAYSRLLAAGIHLKMLVDYEARGGHRSYWKRPTLHGDRPLLLEHYYLAFFLLGVTTTLSVIAFAIELCLGRKMKRGRGDQIERRNEGPSGDVNRESRKVLRGIKKEDQVVEIRGSVPGETVEK